MTSIVGRAIQVAEKYYDDKTFRHATRVAAYVIDMIDRRVYDGTDECFVIGLLHDILEDTSYDVGSLYKDFDDLIADAVVALTKRSEETYDDYIKRIIKTTGRDEWVFLVKKADMKDHLAQYDILTDHLKEKYLKWISYFI